MTGASGAGARHGYLPSLDGVRAIAVLLVMYFHAALLNGPDVFQLPGGAFGVDIFFVLSGFLITTLLLRERDAVGSIGLRHFYARRALRLFPALALTLVLGAAITAYVGDNMPGGRPYWQAAAAAVLYVGNWAEVQKGFALGVLSHTWSLAIEEQFYVLWPLSLSWLLRRGARSRVIAAWLVAPIIAMAVLRVVAYERFGFDAALNPTITHGDGLLMGCALALLLHTSERLRSWLARNARTIGVAGAICLVPLVLAVRSERALHFYELPLVYLVVTFVLGALATADESSTPLGRALSWTPLVALGRISYGVYLYHWPLFYLVLNTGAEVWPAPVRIASSIALTLGVAAVSFLVVERRALSLKNRLKPAVPSIGVADPSAPGLM